MAFSIKFGPALTISKNTIIQSVDTNDVAMSNNIFYITNSTSNSVSTSTNWNQSRTNMWFGSYENNSYGVSMIIAEIADGNAKVLPQYKYSPNNDCKQTQWFGIASIKSDFYTEDLENWQSEMVAELLTNSNNGAFNAINKGFNLIGDCTYNIRGNDENINQNNYQILNEGSYVFLFVWNNHSGDFFAPGWNIVNNDAVNSDFWITTSSDYINGTCKYSYTNLNHDINKCVTCDINLIPNYRYRFYFSTDTENNYDGVILSNNKPSVVVGSVANMATGFKFNGKQTYLSGSLFKGSPGYNNLTSSGYISGSLNYYIDYEVTKNEKVYVSYISNNYNYSYSDTVYFGYTKTYIGPKEPIYIKQNNKWSIARKVYKLQNGIWNDITSSVTKDDFNNILWTKN